ncbi:hypothetical protein DL890_12505 [Klebsiella pneumoniae]|nr:hypothetical protein DL890_12505 [Klebsiella pneumoniae]
MGFLRFCRPASVPVCLPGGAAPTGATGLSRLSPAPVHHITTGNATQYHCPCNQTSLPPPDTIN